jgi:hypothetical protein
MAMKGYRKIVVENASYMWMLGTEYIELKEEPIKYETRIKFTAYETGFRNGPLIIKFTTWEDPIGGNPLTSSAASTINLHRPFYARVLIEQGRAVGCAR